MNIILFLIGMVVSLLPFMAFVVCEGTVLVLIGGVVLLLPFMAFVVCEVLLWRLGYETFKWASKLDKLVPKHWKL